MLDLSMIAYPKLEDIKSALFIQPHPDDNEIGAGGTMALLVKKGIPVYGLTVTEGRGGSSYYSPEQLGEIRKREAQEAMDVLGVKNLGTLGYHNGNPIIHERLVEELVKVIRDIKPYAIFTVDPNLENEMHPVHIAVGKAVQEAYMRSGQVYYPFSENQRHKDAYQVPVIGYYFTLNDNTVVNIEDTYDLKIKAIKKHESQVNEVFLEQLEAMYAIISQTTEYKYAEKLKLLKNIHTHAFAIYQNICRSL